MDFFFVLNFAQRRQFYLIAVHWQKMYRFRRTFPPGVLGILPLFPKLKTTLLFFSSLFFFFFWGLGEIIWQNICYRSTVSFKLRSDVLCSPQKVFPGRDSKPPEKIFPSNCLSPIPWRPLLFFLFSFSPNWIIVAFTVQDLTHKHGVKIPLESKISGTTTMETRKYLLNGNSLSISIGNRKSRKTKYADYFCSICGLIHLYSKQSSCQGVYIKASPISKSRRK